MPRVWRIVKRRHAEGAFDGVGARRTGGRWNNKGTRMVYTAESASLAVLEMLVHLGTASPLPSYMLVSADVPEGLVDHQPIDDLPRNWSASPPPVALQRIGDEWLASGRSAALAVPSAVVPWETNYLLNPAHPDFGRIEIDRSRPFELDPRLAPGGAR